MRDHYIDTIKLKMGRQESVPGLRLADAFAGLSRAYYDEPDSKAKELWQIANKKITAQLLGGQISG